MSKRGQTVKACILLEVVWLMVAIFGDSSSIRYVPLITINLMVGFSFVCLEISLLPGPTGGAEDGNG